MNIDKFKADLNHLLVLGALLEGVAPAVVEAKLKETRHGS